MFYSNIKTNMIIKKLVISSFILLYYKIGYSQQFITDNYITMPHGTGTFILTNGERNANMYSVFSLLPGFELTFQTTLFWKKPEISSTNYFTTNLFGKYMFWVNNSNTGGAAVFLGIGKSPSYFSDQAYAPMHKNYWTALPVTIPIFNNMLSWDIMPGAMVDFEKNSKDGAWGFTYSTRLAIYKIVPQTAIVGEIYGTEEKLYSRPEYKVGLRWEPIDWIVLAATYGGATDGSKASGFEIGIMIFTPQFLTKDFMKNNSIHY